MIDTIYIESGAEEYPKSKEILARYSHAKVIPCNHYKEVFNPSAQSFRLQKKKPALILAKQTGKLVHPIPPSYGVGGKQNYYFSHLLNCLYDCRYCFLQGMFPSAHYLLFVNFEDFEHEILRISESSPESSWFFSGYDCDSLALESVTGFAQHFLSSFRKLPNAWIELRTKSVNTKILHDLEPLANTVVAFSFTPQEVSSQVEQGVPSVKSRISAIEKLADQGWKIGLRIDPLIDCKDFEQRYSNLLRSIFEVLPESALHSVSLGAFRMPNSFYKRIERQYPEEPLFAGNFKSENGYIAYREKTETELMEKCSKFLRQWVNPEKIFKCNI